MGKLEYTLVRDTLFKIYFNNNVELLKRFVTELLGIDYDSVKAFRITNSEIPSEYVEEKFCRLDINMNVDGRVIDLEVQVRNEGYFPERTLFYWAREYSSSIGEGNTYEKLPKTIVISILDFRLFDCKEYVSEFQVLEVNRHTLLSDKFSIEFYELPKLSNSISRENMKELWLALFSAKTEEDLTKIIELGVPIMNEAIAAYRTVTVSPELQRLERMRSDARHEEAQAIQHAREEGRAEKEAENTELRAIITEQEAEKSELKAIIAELKAQKGID